MSIRENLQKVLDTYLDAKKDAYGKANPLFSELFNIFKNIENELKKSKPLQERPKLKFIESMGMGNWTTVPFISILNPLETKNSRKGVYIVFLFRADMSGVYITLNQGVRELRHKMPNKEVKQILQERKKEILPKVQHILKKREFITNKKPDMRTHKHQKLYEDSTIAHKLYEKGNIPPDDEILADLACLLKAYDEYIKHRHTFSWNKESTSSPTQEKPGTLHEAIARILAYIRAKGFLYEDWQIAQYITALRTKPFVILAGITGTGKSKLPALVAEATGGRSELIPVRPDWTDSSDSIIEFKSHR